MVQRIEQYWFAAVFPPPNVPLYGRIFLLRMLYIVLFYSLFWIDPSIAGYALEDDYNPSTFFNMFEFFSGPDPTNGFGRPHKIHNKAAIMAESKIC